MQPPMFGSWSVQVKAIRPFNIHGDEYFELEVIRLDEPATTGFLLRVPKHAVKTIPTIDQKISVTFLMGQVTTTQVI